MSTVTSCCGRARNSAQFQVCRCPLSVVTKNSHWSRSTRGVGPAESTGKSLVRYCPGGRSGTCLPLPRNPRVTTPMPLTLAGLVRYGPLIHQRKLPTHYPPRGFVLPQCIDDWRSVGQHDGDTHHSRLALLACSANARPVYQAPTASRHCSPFPQSGARAASTGGKVDHTHRRRWRPRRTLIAAVAALLAVAGPVIYVTQPAQAAVSFPIE